MWSVFTKGKHPFARRIALVVTGVFAVSGAAWVVITDVLLYELTRDPVLVARIETAKGWTFVVLATALVYWVTYRCTMSLARAQAGLTAVIESIAEGVLLLGPDRTIRRVNPAAARILGCQDLVGLDAREFSRRFRLSYLNGCRVPPDEFISQRVFDEGGPLHYNAVLHSRDGREIVISATAAAVRVYADETPELVVSVFRDITEAEQLSRLRDQFFAHAAHALKTPIAVIKANAQALQGGKQAEADKAAFAIRQQCDRIDLLVQNLFVLARIRSNTLQLYPHEMELAPLVEQVTASTFACWPDHPVRQELESLLRVHADEERIALMLRNVLDEAVRSSPPERAITVRLAQQGRDAAIRIRHGRNSSDGHAAPAACGYDELGINRLVTSTIIHAHGGDLRQDAAGAETMVRISLPAIEPR